jgi:hypothetical protein
MAVLKSGIVLADDEQLVAEIEAEMLPLGTNLVTQLTMMGQRILAKLTGSKMKGYMIVTNKRIIVVEDAISCFVFKTNHSVDYIFSHHVRSLGYQKAPMLCGLFCPEYSVYLTTLTKGWQFVVKGGDEASISKVTDAVSLFLSNASAKNEVL